MSERLMTFGELSENRFRLEGMMIEYPFGNSGNIFVGEIIGTVWWPRRHMKEFRIAEGRLWNPSSKKWTWYGGQRLSFTFEQFERFSGPYEMENGEIFFILDKFLYVRLFRATGKKLEPPLGFEPFYAAHQRFISPNPWKDPIS